jgi:hypothetical protein
VSEEVDDTRNRIWTIGEMRPIEIRAGFVVAQPVPGDGCRYWIPIEQWSAAELAPPGRPAQQEDAA